jgi:hypothetical protein
VLVGLGLVLILFRVACGFFFVFFFLVLFVDFLFCVGVMCGAVVVVVGLFGFDEVWFMLGCPFSLLCLLVAWFVFVGFCCLVSSELSFVYVFYICCATWWLLSCGSFSLCVSGCFLCIACFGVTLGFVLFSLFG